MYKLIKLFTRLLPHSHWVWWYPRYDPPKTTTRVYLRHENGKSWYEKKDEVVGSPPQLVKCRDRSCAERDDVFPFYIEKERGVYPPRIIKREQYF